MPQKFLFLHYGPGGNADLERLWLKDFQDQIDFWDQPKLTTGNFAELAKCAQEKFESDHYSGIIAHSFGCHLVEEFWRHLHKKPASVVFLSPIPDLPRGFAALAKQMNLAIEVGSALSQIRIPQSGRPRHSEMEIQDFWRLVQAVTANPLFYQYYWGQQSALDQFHQLASQLGPLDMSMWQAIISDFLKVSPAPAADSLKPIVVLGAKDPYLVSPEAEQKHWDARGAKVHVLPGVGHYPHLESLFLSDFFRSN